MLRIALTGGIACGKSAASRIFENLGVPVIDTDLISRQLVEPGSTALTQISASFGNEILTQDNSLDRKKLRTIVFADDAKRKQLETILHPLIRREVQNQLTSLKAPYSIVVIPLLAETAQQNDYDRVLLIDCTQDTQLKRLQQRDAISTREASNMISKQASREQRLAIADDIIVNNSDLESLTEQLHRLHEKYLSLANTA